MEFILRGRKSLAVDSSGWRSVHPRARQRSKDCGHYSSPRRMAHARLELTLSQGRETIS